MKKFIHRELIHKLALHLVSVPVVLQACFNPFAYGSDFNLFREHKSDSELNLPTGQGLQVLFPHQRVHFLHDKQEQVLDQ